MNRPLPILIAAFAAYALSWMEFPGRALLIALVVGLIVVPLQMSLIPLLRLYNGVGAFFGVPAKTYVGIWLAHMGFGLPLAIYLLRNYMAGLPKEIMESARVDGASDFDIFVPTPPPPDPCKGPSKGPGHKFDTPDEAGIDMMKSAREYDELERKRLAGTKQSLPERGSWVHKVHNSNPPQYTWEPLQSSKDRDSVKVKIKDYPSDVVGYGHSHPPDSADDRMYDPKSSIDKGNMVLSSRKNTEWGKDNDLKEIRGLNEDLKKAPGQGVTAYLLTPDGQIKKFEDGKYDTAGETLCSQ